MARSREISKPRASDLDFSNHFEIWQAPFSVKFQSAAIITTPNLAASRLHEICRQDVL